MDFNRFCELFPTAKFVKLAPFQEAELTDEAIRKDGKNILRNIFAFFKLF